MQVYAAVHDDMSNYLIVKKRFQNRWWGGALGNPATVNQAGQWAFPGGRQNHGEAAGTTACREFLEETGVDLIGMVDDHGGIAEFFVDPSQTGRALRH